MVVSLFLGLGELFIRTGWFGTSGFQRHHDWNGLEFKSLTREDFPDINWAMVDRQPPMKMEVLCDWADYGKIEVSGPLWDKGLMHLPNVSVHVRVKTHIKEQQVFSVNYSTDNLGRRMTLPQKKEPENSAVIVAGCSFVFGEGVEDQQTLPSSLQRRWPQSRVFNFGRSGSAPNAFLEALEDPEYRFFNDISKEQGYFIYNVIDDHIARSIGSMVRLRKDPFSWLLPNYDVSGDQPRYLGTFEQSRSLIFKAITKSSLATYFGVSFPAEDLGAVQKTAKLLYFIQQRVISKKPQFKFVVVLHPHDPIHVPSLKQELEKLGVNVLDYSRYNIAALMLGRSNLLDGHPSQWSNEVMADLISKDLRTSRY